MSEVSTSDTKNGQLLKFLYISAAHVGDIFTRSLFCCLFLHRVNTYTAINAQAPFGGYKMSGQGREL